MSIELTEIKNPRWSTAGKTSIIVDCLLNGEEVQFVASPTDCTDYGPSIYQECIAGKYGEVAEYAPRVKTLEEIEGAARAELDRRLAEIMTTENAARAEVDDDYKKEYRAAIKDLLDVKKQKGWPGAIVWPGESEV
jgi:hypothetical protein